MSKVRLAAVAAIAALSVAMPAANASEPPPIIKKIVNGCYGVRVTVCDVTVTSIPVELTNRTEPVCAITCQDVTVPVPRYSGDSLCVAWTSSTGTPTEVCTP